MQHFHESYLFYKNMSNKKTEAKQLAIALRIQQNFTGSACNTRSNNDNRYIYIYNTLLSKCHQNINL